MAHPWFRTAMDSYAVCLHPLSGKLQRWSMKILQVLWFRPKSCWFSYSWIPGYVGLHLPWAANECCPSPKNTWKSRVGSPDRHFSHLEMKEFFAVLPEMLMSFTHWEKVCGNEPAIEVLAMVFYLKSLNPYIFFPSQALALRRSSLPAPFDLLLLQHHSQIL